MHQRSWILASFFLLFAFLGYLPFSIPSAFAGEATLTWDQNTESDLKGYKVYIGTQSGIYDGPNSPTFVDKASNSTIVDNLQEGETYYFTITAVDFSGNESAPSDEVSKTFALSDITPPQCPHHSAGPGRLGLPNHGELDRRDR